MRTRSEISSKYPRLGDRARQVADDKVGYFTCSMSRATGRAATEPTSDTLVAELKLCLSCVCSLDLMVLDEAVCVD